MKYAIVLPDGAADDSPLEELGGRTPLEAASIPQIDWVARSGRQGRVVTVPEGITPGTDVATLTLFGYDPHTCYSGRAPLEALAQRLPVAPDQVVFRCNFVNISDGRMQDFTAGHIAQPDADALIVQLNADLGDEGCTFHSGVSYRNLMLISDALDLDLVCAPPHDIPGQAVAGHLPRGAGQQRIRRIMERAAAVLADHPVNRRRVAEGHLPATNIWLWGQGRPVALESFASRFDLAGAVITGVDIIRGIAVGMGMELIHVPGATGYIDTDYAAKGAAAVRALADYDLVVVHVEAADEAGHLGDAAEKVKALERIDAEVVAPLLEALRRQGEFRILVAPDHPTPVSTKAHSAVPPPFCYAGTGVPAGAGRPFSEKDALACGVMVDPGIRLIEAFLGRR